MISQVSGYQKSVCVFLFLFLFCSYAVAQTAGKLTGVITDTKGNAVETASVSLNNSLVTLSDEQGRFTLMGIKSGEYDYRVSCLGYEEVRGKTAFKGDGTDRLDVKLKPLALTLHEVTVTARQQSMGSKSVIGQDAIRHIQPKSVADMLQLLPGALTVNPSLNNLGQANIREIDGNASNALGTAVILDGIPVSNDANLQAVSTSKAGARSGLQSDGMSQQTTAGRGVDLRTMGADNIESVEVIRGIPGVEYGNLTSGVVVIKTKAGRSPLEVKLKADPFSKLAYVGKGFGFKHGGTINAGIDWSQSYADVRKRYQGYDRITASAGYSNIFNAGSEHPVTFHVNGSFYSNINTYKRDPQLQQLQLNYKNENVGGRLSVRGNIKMNNFLTAIDYDFSAQIARMLDTHHDWVSNPDGVITNSMVSGEAQAQFLTRAYYSDYRIEGKPYNFYAQVKTNKYVQLGSSNFMNIKLGFDYRLDGNSGRGLMFDMSNPPQAGSAQTLRPRSYRDIPAMQALSMFVEDNSTLRLGTTSLQFAAGVRISNLFLNKDKAKQGSIFVAEPRANLEYTFLTKKNNSLFDKLAISGGFGISNKMPTLLYLYPDNAYFDSNSLSYQGGTGANSALAIMTTKVISDTQNAGLRPARSTKWEIGLNARTGKMKGYITYFSERHRHELGFDSRLAWLNYNRYNVPVGASDLSYNHGVVNYTYAGATQTATVTPKSEMVTWSFPINNGSTDKHGIEYSWDFGTFAPLRTSLNVDGAWFHIKRKSETPSVYFIQKDYDYASVLPAGEGSVSDRFNTNFRFITHIPQVKMIFTTTLQVVWYESSRIIYEDKAGASLYHLSAGGTHYVVSPSGFYNRQAQWTPWQTSYDNDPRYSNIARNFMIYAFKADNISPWAMLNFRFTKELGKVAELSFMANNFLNMRKYHVNSNSGTKSKLHPDSYFGAEIKLKF